MISTRALHRNRDACRSTNRIAPHACREHNALSVKHFAADKFHARHASILRLHKRLHRRIKTHGHTKSRQRTHEPNNQVARRTMRAVLHMNRASNIIANARIAPSQCRAINAFPRITERFNAARLSLRNRHVFRPSHYIKPTIARVVAMDLLSAQHLFKDVECLQSHRAKHAHAAIEMTLIRVQVKVPQPLHEFAIKPWFDVERCGLREHPLQAAHRRARPREWKVTDREQPSVASTRAFTDAFSVAAFNDRDIKAFAGKMPRC